VPRTLLISKLRMAAEWLDQPRERSGIEPNRHVPGQLPSSRPWKWSIPIVGILALFRIATETITKRLDRPRERSGVEPYHPVRGQLPSSRPWKWTLATVGILAFLGLAGWQSVKHLGGLQQGAKYRLAKVERSAITASISATGTLNPVIMVQVGTQVSGTVEKLFADFNSTVVPGQQLAQLDQASFRAKVLQAEANLDTARADVKNAMANVHNVRTGIETARADMASRSAQRERARVAIVDAKRILERQQALFARGLLPRNDVETAQTAYDTAAAQYNATQADLESAEAKLRAARAQLVAAEAQVEKANAQVHQAQAALEQARVDLERTIIRSPVTGTVISRSVDVGQTVAASLQSPTLFIIAQDLTKMQVDTNVSEADIGAVTVGQVATFTVDAYPGQVLRGTVREIRSAPIVVQNVVNYNAVIAVDNPEMKLKPGMTATVSILVAQRENVLKIPKAALRFQPPLTPQEREQFIQAFQKQPMASASKGLGAAPRKAWQTTPKVWTLTSKGALWPIAVRLGISDDQFSELHEGSLQEGQELIIGLNDHDGQRASGGPPSSTSRPPPVRF
jgi:HlyD family secretion protein